ncbi:cation-translocating P-type ATPase [Bosea psychrotolerans]|uniref:Calcium-translocating P-type ATPase n=1 Tax=Bosea psychrotolerans TaxID=1871628 RepID=A0A2S4LXE9_9HYPH|nr:cation-transporting P-type ATPase [Bosea psychrotolerans]POR47116.1 calcium-translocating P-type ATPase [Bosea psychrotolerans]
MTVTCAGLKPWHCLSPEAALARLDSSAAGLSQAEAARRLAHYGPNLMPAPQARTVLGVYLSQFRSPFIYLLLGASVISLGLGRLGDALFIFSVLVLNAAIGAFQEWQAEQRARALKALIVGTTAVWRDGRLAKIPIEQLVPGDVVEMESGAQIAADMRLLDINALTVDESLLTGESFASAKDATATIASEAGLGDRATMLHAGTTVMSGRGRAVVVATARDTQMGLIAAELAKPEPPPPLIRRMAHFTNHVAIAMVGTIAIVALLELARGAPGADILLLAIALAVSAIPEGLPIAMTVTLSIAAQQMGHRHVVVRRLAAVEGLGACTLIATDKTGTLTRNELTVTCLWIPGLGDVGIDHPSGHELLRSALRASDAPSGSADGPVGDAVDLAFTRVADNLRLGLDTREPAHRHPYEPEQRYAATFHHDGESLIAYVKGAPETVAAFCKDVDADALVAAQRLASAGYRVIAVAAGGTALTTASKPKGLHFLGLAALTDPLRPEAKQAVAHAQQAGLRVVLITGDHPLTALAIARELGLAEHPIEIVSGEQLAQVDGAALDRLVSNAHVFARTEPMQKLAIVESLRRQGHVVAVTGDGINDSAALKAADIGVAMGKSGCDVAREAADLILIDDNFASIIAGIEAGRIAYDNLRKVILLTLSTGAAEILLMLLSTLFQLPPPLSAAQLLWLNLITNGIQDVALAFEAGDPKILERPPRPSNEPIFDRRMIEQLMLGGAVIGLIAFGYYYVALEKLGSSQAAAQGAVLWLLVWCENAHCFNCRSEQRSAFAVPLASNLFLVTAVLGTQLLQAVVLWVPSLRDLLSMEAMTLTHGLVLGSAGLIVLGAMEFYKRARA